MTNPTETTSRPEFTNSLVITFTTYSEEAANKLYTLLSKHGQLSDFCRLKSFERCLAVFNSTSSAIAAKRALHGSIIAPNNKINLNFSMHTTTDATAANNHLLVPEREKLMLISPPGSPSIGWVQDVERSPNKKNMDKDLLKAIKALDGSTFTIDLAEVASITSIDSNDSIESVPFFALDSPSDKQLCLDSSTNSDADSLHLNQNSIEIISKENTMTSPLATDAPYPVIRIDTSTLDSDSDNSFSHSKINSRQPTPISKTPFPT
ncbi:hypothetical protein BB561_001872 [Smittium simulii]|uniref:Calcipressin n=1 Tax=Smittium simulii TaxID=133385 RepID=A0A2T9YSP4_9FUNG|nr:hypothetical protein BB561_001872 [Smittium simulii]